MAKQQTKKDLQDKLELAQEVIERNEKHIAGLEKEVEGQIQSKNIILQEIGYMLSDEDELIMSGRPMFHHMGNDTMSAINNTPKMSLPMIAYKISKLQVYKKEYFELKDRVLPIPKTVVLQEERNLRDRRN